MKRFLYASLLVAVVCAGTAPFAASHCEVPCGIFHDKHRFERMLEDSQTMQKAMAQINELVEKKDAQSANQIARWISTKGEHAKNTQHVIAQYFMAQRIKPNAKNYVEQLTAAHAVMISAMKCKQTTNVEYVVKTHMPNIEKLYKAYMGEDMRAPAKDK